ncbi:MAG: lysozyme inhibitor LprI family protein, partial [Lachnospiraceae bacterium]|nr:lysozyme inhibitor LprI family protein [Lachnospiraceae bacterium]
LSNFCIEAEEGADVSILIDDPYSPVLCFDCASYLTLRNLTMGHNVEPGYCAGSVVDLENCNHVTIDKGDLFGCGTYAISASNCDSIDVKNSDLHDCSYGLIDFVNVYNSHFTNTTLRDSKDMSMINVNSGYGISFERCTFSNNAVTENYDTQVFVNITEYTDVTFTDCKFVNNTYDSFSNLKVKMVNCNISDNGGDMEAVEQINAVDRESLDKEYDEAVKKQEEIDKQLNDTSIDQQTMNQLAYEEFNVWDTYLNNLWQYLRATLSTDTMDYVTEEQREWIKQKEADAKEAGAEFEGGSMQPMMEYSTSASLTRKRAEDLMLMYLD